MDYVVKNLLDSVIDKGLLEESSTIRFNCPACTDIRSRFYITRRVDEETGNAFLLYNCFNCQEHGRYNIDPVRLALPIQDVAETTRATASYKRAQRLTLVNMPYSAMQYLDKKYPKLGFSLSKSYGLVYDNVENAIVYQIKNVFIGAITGEQRRYLYKPHSPKYITEWYDNRIDFKHHIIASCESDFKLDLVVLTEDILASNYIMDTVLSSRLYKKINIACVGMLGLSFSFEDIYKLMQGFGFYGKPTALLWTDWDNHEVVKKTLDIKSKFEIMGWIVKSPKTFDDPKMVNEMFILSEIQDAVEPK
jgi:hypothetical protein